MSTKHEFSKHELNLILMALDFAIHNQAFDLDDEAIAQELVKRLQKESKE